MARLAPILIFGFAIIALYIPCVYPEVLVDNTSPWPTIGHDMERDGRSNTRLEQPGAKPGIAWILESLPFTPETQPVVMKSPDEEDVEFLYVSSSDMISAQAGIKTSQPPEVMWVSQNPYVTIPGVVPPSPVALRDNRILTVCSSHSLCIANPTTGARATSASSADPTVFLGPKDWYIVSSPAVSPDGKWVYVLAMSGALTPSEHTDRPHGPIASPTPTVPVNPVPSPTPPPAATPSPSPPTTNGTAANATSSPAPVPAGPANNSTTRVFRTLHSASGNSSSQTTDWTYVAGSGAQEALWKFSATDGGKLTVIAPVVVPTGAVVPAFATRHIAVTSKGVYYGRSSGELAHYQHDSTNAATTSSFFLTTTVNVGSPSVEEAKDVDHVFFTALDSHAYRVDFSATGEPTLKWKTELPQVGLGIPLFSDRNSASTTQTILVVGTKINALNFDSGEPEWSRRRRNDDTTHLTRESHTLLNPAALGGDHHVYVSTLGDTALSSYHSDTGLQSWAMSGGSTGLSLSLIDAIPSSLGSKSLYLPISKGIACLQIVPSLPGPNRPTLADRSDTWLEVTWVTPGTTTVKYTSFIVEYHELACGTEGMTWTSVKVVENKYKIDNLDPGTIYCVRVTAAFGTAQTNPSPDSNFITQIIREEAVRGEGGNGDGNRNIVIGGAVIGVLAVIAGLVSLAYGVYKRRWCTDGFRRVEQPPDLHALSAIRTATDDDSVPGLQSLPRAPTSGGGADSLPGNMTQPVRHDDVQVGIGRGAASGRGGSAEFEDITNDL